MPPGLNEALFEAIAQGDLHRVRELIGKDPTIAGARDGAGLSAVIQAKYRWRDDLVGALLEARPELDIHAASAVGDTDRVSELLSSDPALAAEWSADGYTALHLASFFGHPEVARRLLDAGADVSAVSRNAMAVMPLHSATASGQREIIELLVGRNANPNARTHGGWTPLLEAAQNGDRDLVALFLSLGANPTLTQDEGKAALDLAEAAGHDDVVELLRGQPT